MVHALLDQLLLPLQVPEAVELSAGAVGEHLGGLERVQKVLLGLDS